MNFGLFHMQGYHMTWNMRQCTDHFYNTFMKASLKASISTNCLEKSDQYKYMFHGRQSYEFEKAKKWVNYLNIVIFGWTTDIYMFKILLGASHELLTLFPWAQHMVLQVLGSCNYDVEWVQEFFIQDKIHISSSLFFFFFKDFTRIELIWFLSSTYWLNDPVTAVNSG